MNKKGMVSFFSILLALTLVFSAVPAFAENNAYVRKTDAGRINLRSGPASQYRVLAAIEPLTPLEVLDVEGKWAHVYVANPNGLGQLEGYMYTDYIEDSSGLIVHSYPMNTAPQYTQGNSYTGYSGYSGYYSFATITENTPMYIYTGNSGRLHLREYASQSARSLGLFPSGTQVTVLNRSGSWAYVSVNGLYGYMMLNYLTSTRYNPVQPIQPISGAVTKYIYTGNSGRLHLREYASQNARSLGLFPNGTQVSATELSNGWSYVTFGGYAGYMMTRYLTTTPYNPSPVPEQYTIKYVYSPTGSKVVLRSAMSQASSALGSFDSGTLVYVFSNLGSWSYVSIGGLQGYMLNNTLSDTPYTPILPGPSIGTATVQHPNGSFVYLRSTRSTDDLDNVLAKVPSGAQVTLYQTDEWYSLVQYNGITGYMVSHYLYFGTAPAPAPTAPPAGNTVIKMIVGGASVRSSRDESSSANILMELPHGTMVEILLTYPDNWRYIEYNGVKGYIHGQNVASVVDTGTSLSPLMPTVPESPVIATGEVWHPNGSFVNLRYSRSTADNSNVLAQVPYGSKIEVMEQNSSNWSKVRYNGIVGYMVSTYVHLNGRTAPAVTTVPASIPSVPLTPATPITAAPTEKPASVSSVSLTPATPTNTKPVSLSGNQRVVRNSGGSYVNLRCSEDSNSTANILKKVPNGTVVDVVRFGEEWCLVRVSGLGGYIATRYLKTK